MSASRQLYNLWTGVDGIDVYAAYVVERDAPAGLAQIDSPPPIQQSTLNWLNIFYAAEWVIFAGFAIFFWYRLVKDAKETRGRSCASWRRRNPPHSSGNVE